MFDSNSRNQNKASLRFDAYYEANFIWGMEKEKGVGAIR